MASSATTQLQANSKLEEALLTRVYSIADQNEYVPPDYIAGLREAVSVALRYGLAGIERDQSIPAKVPVELLAQARRAARNGVGLDTVLRRYHAGYLMLEDHLIRTFEEGEKLISGPHLRRPLRRLSSLFDATVSTVAEEYVRELEDRPSGLGQRRFDQVKRLLGGELVDADDLGYEIDGWHIAAIAVGSGARGMLQSLADELDRRLLCVGVKDGAVWAWLGGRDVVTSQEALQLAKSFWKTSGSLAFGEPGKDLRGWRLTHQQARAAFPIALRGTPRVLRYADFTLLSAALNEDVLAGSLRDVYLAPLESTPDGGVALRQTLDAYFSAGRNVSSAAAALGVSRQTVNSRLRTVEERIGKQLTACAPELETALRLHHLSSSRLG